LSGRQSLKASEPGGKAFRVRRSFLYEAAAEFLESLVVERADIQRHRDVAGQRFGDQRPETLPVRCGYSRAIKSLQSDGVAVDGIRIVITDQKAFEAVTGPDLLIDAPDTNREFPGEDLSDAR